MKRLVSLGLLILTIITQTACGGGASNGKDLTEVSDRGFYLDTDCQIMIPQIEEERGEELIEQAFGLCENYESKMSKTINGSDVDRINHAEGKTIKVDEATSDVISMALEMSEESDGAFDITIGRLTDLWDFKSNDPKVPGDADIKAALETVDYKNVVVDGNEVTLKNKNAHIDLGGIAKGYISYKVAEFLHNNGVEHALINFGGNVVTLGNKPDGSAWKVGIQDPNGENQDVVGVTEAISQAVITSGIYERKFEVGGKIYHHIIDPKTGYPVDNDIKGVSLKCGYEDAARCDAYSTICLLKGVKAGKKFIEDKAGFEAVFYDEDDRITVTNDMGFEKN